MHCDDIKKLLPKYIDDELTPGEDNLIDTHLEKCSDCSKVMQNIEKERALSRLMDDSIPEYEHEEEEAQKLSLYKKFNILPMSIKLSLGFALFFLVTALTSKYMLHKKITIKETDNTFNETFILKDSLPYNKAKHSLSIKQSSRNKISPLQKRNVRSTYTAKGPLSIEPNFAAFPQTYNITFEVVNIENIIPRLCDIVSEFDGTVVLSQPEDDNTYSYAFQLSNMEYPAMIARLKRIGHIREKDKITAQNKAGNVSYAVVQLRIIQF